MRPTTDRVKESMFAPLQFVLPGATVLDMFAGSGALGIEAASRGADCVILCEENKKSGHVIRENLRRPHDPSGIELFACHMRKFCAA